MANSILILKNGEVVHRLSNCHPREIANILMNDIKMDLLSPINNALVLHSALVSFENQSILLPGNSGNGKSLFTLGLLSLGCQYHTDEVVLFDNKHNLITPFIRPLMIKSHGINGVRQLVSDSFDKFFQPGHLINSIPVDTLAEYFSFSSAQVKDPPPFGGIVFPHFNRQSKGEIIPLSPAQTMIELFKNNVAARNIPDLGSEALKQLCMQTKGAKIEYGSYEQLPALFEKIQLMMQ